MEALINLAFLLFLLALGYFAGSAAERRHYRSIESREASLLALPAVTLRTVLEPATVDRAVLVDGSVVVSVDYFKRVLAGLRFLVGGRVKSYESLLDRARREAVLRMKEAAGGADEIVNVRIETTSISKGAQGRNQTVATVEVIAYGTAIYRRGQR